MCQMAQHRDTFRTLLSVPQAIGAHLGAKCYFKPTDKTGFPLGTGSPALENHDSVLGWGEGKGAKLTDVHDFKGEECSIRKQ